MSELARRSPAVPAASGWADYRRQMTTAAQAIVNAWADYLAAGGGDDGPEAARFDLVLGVLQELGAVARSIDVGEAVIDALCDRAVEQDRAEWPRLRAVN